MIRPNPRAIETNCLFSILLTENNHHAGSGYIHEWWRMIKILILVKSIKIDKAAILTLGPLVG
jgi:hypothetical protein